MYALTVAAPVSAKQATAKEPPLTSSACVLARDDANNATSTFYPSNVDSLDIIAAGLRTTDDGLFLSAQIAVKSLSSGPNGTPIMVGTGDIWHVQFQAPDATVYFLEAAYGLAAAHDNSTPPAAQAQTTFVYGKNAPSTLPTRTDVVRTTLGLAKGGLHANANYVEIVMPLSAMPGVHAGSQLTKFNASAKSQLWIYSPDIFASPVNPQSNVNSAAAPAGTVYDVGRSCASKASLTARPQLPARHCLLVSDPARNAPHPTAAQAGNIDSLDVEYAGFSTDTSGQYLITDIQVLSLATGPNSTPQLIAAADIWSMTFNTSEGGQFHVEAAYGAALAKDTGVPPPHTQVSHTYIYAKGGANTNGRQFIATAAGGMQNLPSGEGLITMTVPLSGLGLKIGSRISGVVVRTRAIYVPEAPDVWSVLSSSPGTINLNEAQSDKDAYYEVGKTC